MKFRALILPAISICLVAAPALANWVALDGNRNPFSFLGLNIGGLQEQQVSPSDASGVPFSQSNPFYIDLMLGSVLMAPGPQSKSEGIPIAPPIDPDTRFSALTITAADSASSTASGQNGASIITGSPTANSFVSQSVNGVSTARIQLSGTWVGTISLEQSIDGGTTYGAMGCHVNGTAFSAASVTGNGIFDCEVAGATNIRVRATALASGTVVLTETITTFTGVVKVMNTLPGASSTDASGTIGTGGSYQTIIAASGSRKGCFIQNPTTATEVLNVKFGTMANPITLAAGSFIDCNRGNMVLQDAVTVMGATLGHAFTALVQ